MPRANLQPIHRFALLALGFHVLLGAGLWRWFHRANGSLQPPAEKSLTWISPANFQPSRPLVPSAAQVTRAEIESEPMPKVPPPPEPVPKAIAIDPAKAMELMKARLIPGDEPLPQVDEARAFTVSTHDPAPVRSSATRLGSVTGGDDKGGLLDDVNNAIINELRRNWTPPDVNTLNVEQRTAHMDVTVDRAGRVLDFKIAKSSGNHFFDLSVLEAANHLDRIHITLPASYSGNHYELQVHFHVE